MVATEEVRQPGRLELQFPVACDDGAVAQLLFTTDRLQAIVSANIEAITVRVDFALAAETAAAGSIAQVLWTSGFWTKIGQVRKRAVPTFATVDANLLRQLLDPVDAASEDPIAVRDMAGTLCQAKPRCVRLKERTVKRIHRPIV